MGQGEFFGAKMKGGNGGHVAQRGSVPNLLSELLILFPSHPSPIHTFCIKLMFTCIKKYLPFFLVHSIEYCCQGKIVKNVQNNRFACVVCFFTLVVRIFEKSTCQIFKLVMLSHKFIQR